MGKRELLLIGVFVVLGVVVYQFAAPPSDPGQARWSFSGLVEQLRREVRGNQATAEVTRTQTIAVRGTVREIRLTGGFASASFIGEDREDIEAELKITSRAYDDDEARRTAEATRLLNADEAGELIMLSMYYPREGRQSVAMVFKVPARLAVRVDEKGGTLKISQVASVTIGTGRGETVISDVPGRVRATQRGNTITVTDVGPLTLTTLNAQATVARVRGAATLNLQGGELRAESIDGPIEAETRNIEMRFEKLEKTQGPIRINATGGEAFLSGVQTETRIDGRGTDIRVDQTSASLLSIYNVGDEAVEVTMPPNGFTLDALAINGGLSVDPSLAKAGITVTAPADGDADEPGERIERRAAGEVRGGGPIITLRANRGDIVLKSRN